MLDPLCAIAATVKTDLATRVHNLPPELFNLIHDYTFTLDAPSTTTPLTIDPTHQPPHLLQIDPLTRSHLAHEYYARPDPIYLPNHILAAQWLCALPAAHRALLRDVRVGSALPEGPASMLDAGNFLAKMQWGYIVGALRREGMEIGAGVLRFRVSAPVGAGEKGESGKGRERVWAGEFD